MEGTSHSVVAAAALSVLLSLALHGCGGKCESSDTNCLIKEKCDGECNQFTITSKEMANKCVRCVKEAALSKFKTGCREENSEKEDKCVRCVTKTSATCWAKPKIGWLGKSRGKCLAGPCRASALIEDPLACPKCWTDYLERGFDKHAACLSGGNGTPPWPNWLLKQVGTNPAIVVKLAAEANRFRIKEKESQRVRELEKNWLSREESKEKSSLLKLLRSKETIV